MTTTDMPTGPGRSLECDALAPLLALRDTGLLDAAEAARVEEHIASCQACRRDAALDGALADHLRGALLPAAHVAPALTVEQITEAAATATDESDAASADSVGAYPAEARRAVRLRSAVARRLSALPALAAALAVAILAAYIFGSRVGPGAGPRPMPAATLSPTLAQQTVFLPTDVGIYALRASDGKLRWTFPAGIETTPIQHSQPIGDLALDQGTLYALAAPPGTLAQPEVQLIALNAADGSVRWSVVVPGSSTASFVRVGDLLVVAPTSSRTVGTPEDERTVEALSAADGHVVWRRALDEQALSNLVSAAGDSVYIGTTGHVVALNTTDGTVRWTSPIVPSAQQEGTTLAAAYSSVALTTAGDRILVLAKRNIKMGDNAAWEANLYALATADGSHLWRDGVEDDPWGTAYAPVVDGDAAYVALGGGLTAFSLAGTTPAPRWRFIPDGSTTPNEAMTGAAASDGIVYVTDLYGVVVHRDGHAVEENFTYAVRAADGAELWRAPTNGGLDATPPAIGGGLVLARAGGILHALRAADGHELWRCILPGGGKVSAPLFG